MPEQSTRYTAGCPKNKNGAELLRLIAELKLDHIERLFFSLWLAHLRLQQGIPCLLEASNKTTGTILSQVVNLRCFKKAHNFVPHG